MQSHTKHPLKPSAVDDIIVYRYHYKGKNRRFCVLTRKLATRERDHVSLEHLNELRALRNKVPLTHWLSGRIALAQAIEHEQGVRSPSTAREINDILSGVQPRVKRLPPAPTKPTTKPITGLTAAAVLSELGIDSRRGRALLRKHNIPRDDPAAIRKFFKEQK